MWLIIKGFIVHVIFLLSIFDIYFKSPIIDGIEVQKNNIPAPAKRLVLFVADGLRSDSFFVLENEHRSTLYLRKVLDEKGAWGVCHASVPTESRPGHVALIAGFYEDPSAVFRGWKENPVNFDSVFNQSERTYSWGSPDILPMFSKGAASGKVYTFMYSSEIESFSGKNESASSLNDWVFNNFEEFLKEVKQNTTTTELLNRNGIIFFLHLLGTDIAGHVNKPHSSVYKDNIIGVDEGIAKVVTLIDEFYNNDSMTAFVFTSDHGMTDWGSHGDGSASETETPIVVWGAGLSHAIKLGSPDFNSPKNWGLQNVLRRDIRQPDLVPLMSVLLGIPIPTHSLGTLPLFYMNVDEKHKAEAILLNSRQLLSHFRRHREIIEEHSITWLYRQFPGLKADQDIAALHNIEQLISSKQYNVAITESNKLISLVLSGLRYYQNYYQTMLLFAVTCSYIGWIVWLSFQILPHTRICYQKANSNKLKRHIMGYYYMMGIDGFFLILQILLVKLISVQKLPAQYYVYCCLPVLLWWSVVRNHSLFSVIFLYIRRHISETLMMIVIYAIGIELLVLTFFYRGVLSIVMCGLGIWPFFEPQCKKTPRIIMVLWIITSFGLALFPNLPTIGSSPCIKLVICSGWFWLIAGLVFIIFYVRVFKTKEECLLLVFLVSLFPITIWLVSSTDDSFKSNEGLPTLNQILSWMLLVMCPLLPFVGSVNVVPRLAAISLSIAVPFHLLSIGYEGLFVLVLMANLSTWITLEANIISGMGWYKNVKKTQDYLTKADFRRAFFFLVYIVLSFFGTGNIASVNSFDPVWVRCFLTSFSPFTMTVLILMKVLVPFLLVSCSFQALNIVTKAWSNETFIMLLILSNFMGLHFLYAVTNEGSWLKIGTSISHYVIIQAMILFFVALYSIAKFYMQSSFWRALPARTICLSGECCDPIYNLKNFIMTHRRIHSRTVPRKILVLKP